MAAQIPEIYLGDDALPALTAFCANRGWDNFLVVADTNTLPVLGAAVQGALQAAGWQAGLVVLPGDSIAGEAAILQVALAAGGGGPALVAVGSGTLTDVVRFSSHRMRTPFLSVPTAPSVDGYVSPGAPLVVNGLKRTVACKPPQAVFAHLPTLCAAPAGLIAAGFGDLATKLLSVADWELGGLLWGERYDAAIAERARAAAHSVLPPAAPGLPAGLARRDPPAIRALMNGLLVSGLCMLAFGGSQPASGVEHHLSHFWEQRLLSEGRPPILHGLKVGVAAVISAGWYQHLRARGPAGPAWLRPVDPAEERELLAETFGGQAALLEAEQDGLLLARLGRDMEFRRRVEQSWGNVQRIAAGVPSPQDLADWLGQAGAPAEASALGLSPDEVRQAASTAHYLRPRFTVAKLDALIV